MTIDRWNRVAALLASVRRLDAPSRRREVLQLGGEDPALADEVEALLEHGAVAESEGLLEPPDTREDAEEERPSPGLAPGTRVARYEIRRLVGQGGMGTVYEAERLEPYRQRVALKVLGTRPSPIALKRFDTERQLLSEVEDPRVVRLLDGGTTDSGQPYLVMEFIEGDRIDAYCDRLELPVAERVRLVAQVAGALAHVHEHGILHRDLKPGNVLVNRQGIPKVTDFGVARSMRGGRGATLTGPGIMPGTPGYMAPEQITGGPGRNLPGVDVYGLGATLYRLLAGRPPFPSDTPMETCLRVTTEDPPSPRGRNPAVPRDLETIVLKALARDPLDRFAGMDELAEQLRRFLEHEPLTIHPPSAWVRFGKWAYRHRSGLTAWVASTLLILGLMTGLLIARNRTLTRTEATLEKLLGHVGLASEDLLQDLPPGSDRTHAYFQNMVGFYETALREAADEASPQLRRRTGLMHYHLARSMAERSDFAGAIDHQDRALELLRPLPEYYRGRVEYPWTRFDVFRCLQARGTARLLRRELAAAESDTREALREISDLSRDEPGSSAWLGEYANQHRLLADQLREQARLGEAEAHAGEAIRLIERARQMSPEDERHLFKSHWAFAALGGIRIGQERLREGIAAYRSAKDVADELVRRRGDDWEAQSAAIDAGHNLGSFLALVGRNAEAEPLFREALDRSKVLVRAFPETDSYLVRDARLRTLLGKVLHATGRVRDAEDPFRTAIADLDRLIGKRRAQREARVLLASILDECPILELRDPDRAAELRAAISPGGR